MPSTTRTRSALEWTTRAACRDQDPDLFFPTGRRAIAVQKAKAVCAGCPVRPDCLEESVARPERYGVFGGLDQYERRRLLEYRAGLVRDAAGVGA